MAQNRFEMQGLWEMELPDWDGLQCELALEQDFIRVVQQILEKFPGVNLFGWLGIEMPPPTEIWTDDIKVVEERDSPEMFWVWLKIIESVPQFSVE